jgi:hypothetical protein
MAQNPAEVPERLEMQTGAVPAVEPKAVTKQIQEVKIKSRLPVFKINAVKTSPDAGVNVQEALAAPVAEFARGVKILGSENKNAYQRWNRLSGADRPEKRSQIEISRVRSEVSELSRQLREAQQSIRRQHPAPAASGTKHPWWVTVGTISAALVVVAAGVSYLSGDYFGAIFNSVRGQASQSKVAGASTSAVGRAKILKGRDRAAVENENITAASAILVTLRGNYAGRYWIAEQSPGKFMLQLSESAAEDTLFDYWIIQNDFGTESPPRN